VISSEGQTMFQLLVLRFKGPVEHLSSIVTWLGQQMSEKYKAGQQEHGGELWMKPGALRNLEEEIIDLPIYYKTAKDQLKQMALDGRTAEEAYDFLYGQGHKK
jgi:hypothetical protein